MKMQDVTKTIEEMAEVLNNTCTGVNIEQACTFANCNECKAKALYNAGYRKIDEDANIENYTKEDILLYLKDNHDCDVVDRAELNAIIRSVLSEALAFTVADVFYFSEKKLNELIEAYTGIEESEE